MLITYENEAILAKQKGEDLDYIIPDDSFLIENPAPSPRTPTRPRRTSSTSRSATRGRPSSSRRASAPSAPDITDVEVEGANDPADPFPVPASLGTIARPGGWSEVTAEWFGKDGEKLRFDKLYDAARS